MKLIQMSIISSPNYTQPLGSFSTHIITFDTFFQIYKKNKHLVALFYGSHIALKVTIEVHIKDIPKVIFLSKKKMT